MFHLGTTHTYEHELENEPIRVWGTFGNLIRVWGTLLELTWNL